MRKSSDTENPINESPRESGNENPDPCATQSKPPDKSSDVPLSNTRSILNRIASLSSDFIQANHIQRSKLFLRYSEDSPEIKTLELIFSIGKEVAIAVRATLDHKLEPPEYLEYNCSTIDLVGFAVNIYLVARKPVPRDSSVDRFEFFSDFFQYYQEEIFQDNTFDKDALKECISKLSTQEIIKCVSAVKDECTSRMGQSRGLGEMKENSVIHIRNCDDIVQTLNRELNRVDSCYVSDLSDEQIKKSRRKFERIISSCKEGSSAYSQKKVTRSDDVDHVWYEIWPYMVSRVGYFSNSEYFDMIATILSIVSSVMYERDQNKD